jgi:hypothetical protein
MCVAKSFFDCSKESGAYSYRCALDGEVKSISPFRLMMAKRSYLCHRMCITPQNHKLQFRQLGVTFTLGRQITVFSFLQYRQPHAVFPLKCYRSILIHEVRSNEWNDTDRGN